MQVHTMATKREKIIVVEAEADILEVIQYNLKREGFRVKGVRDGEEGLDRVRRDNPSLVLLDLMLPGMDGLEICRRLKEDPVTRNVPVIMVTAKGEESDVVLGLGLGADDYIVKPFSPRELVALVKAVLRWAPLVGDREVGERITQGPLSIDLGRHDARIDGEPMSLTATEMRLLHFLAAYPGRVFTRDQLLSRVIGQHAVVIDRNIDVHIGSVRKKLGEHRDMLETVRGVGYRFRE
jgi:two-component system phosphate regulon response regulator PhoB